MLAPHLDKPHPYRNPSPISSSIQSLAQSLPQPFPYLGSLMKQSGEHGTVTNDTRKRGGRRWFSHIASITNVLILIWLCTIWWGESLVFKASLAACQWDQWEQWPLGARPHHVVLIADPQLVDPHTYPGRPWPLSSLTITYTDLYLHRAYAHLQRYLQPDTLFFLGDLFDGGREWATWHSSSPDGRYKRYGNRYWMKEYKRFKRIFIDGWLDGGLDSPAERRGRKIIASLPGNHDLGFASGIQGPVKERFEAYFGTGNRIDMIGNHSFISVDTVSLSAMDQADPITGSSGTGDGTSASAANRNIWGPTEDFLSTARQVRQRAIRQELRMLSGLPEQSSHDPGLTGFTPNLTDLTDLTSPHPPPPATPHPSLAHAEPSIPIILLTHVPLYRAPNTDCGPHRERGKAIAEQSGYQYQNVLTPVISKEIVSRLGVEEIRHVYSGDDHDYCEIEHGEFTGRIREITVKSMSWAMGVRRPGFLAVSLWNPLDLDLDLDGGLDRDRDLVRSAEGGGKGVKEGEEEEVAVVKKKNTKRETIQNHLCLLPDQLAIFTRYGLLLLLTVVALAMDAVRVSAARRHGGGRPLLPLTQDRDRDRDRDRDQDQDQDQVQVQVQGGDQAAHLQHHSRFFPLPSHAIISSTSSSSFSTHHTVTVSGRVGPGHGICRGGGGGGGGSAGLAAHGKYVPASSSGSSSLSSSKEGKADSGFGFGPATGARVLVGAVGEGGDGDGDGDWQWQWQWQWHWGTTAWGKLRRRFGRVGRRGGGIMADFRCAVLKVAGPVLVFYFALLWWA